MALLLADDHRPLPHADRFVRSVAGSESNVAVGVARLGHRVGFTGRVGADAAGSWVRDALRAEGVDIAGLMIDGSRPTGLLVRDSPSGRPVSVAYYRSGSAASALCPDDVRPGLVAAARCVFLSGITAMLSSTAAQFVRHVLDVAREAGVPVLFDPNVRLRLADRDTWRAMLADVLDDVDTLLIGHEELDLLGLPDDPAKLITPRTRTVVVKRGADGATACTADETVHQPARAVNTIDPVGAGDAFCAGWISAWLRNSTLHQSLREATAVASFVVASPTDTAGLPSADERDRALEENGADVDR